MHSILLNINYILYKQQTPPSAAAGTGLRAQLISLNGVHKGEADNSVVISESQKVI